MNVVVSLIAPTAATRGMLRNIFLEVQANLFVGQLNGKQVAELVESLTSLGAVGVVVAGVRSAPLGVRIKQLGPADRTIVDFDGLQVVKRTKAKSMI